MAGTAALFQSVIWVAGDEKLYPEEWAQKLKNPDPAALKQALKQSLTMGKSSKSPDAFFEDLLTRAEQR